MNKGHISSGEVINLKTLKKGKSADTSLALVKTKDMEVIRMVVKRGKAIPEHSVEGEVSVQCLKGEVLFRIDRKSTRLNSSHVSISYAVFCLKKKNDRMYTY